MLTSPPYKAFNGVVSIGFSSFTAVPMSFPYNKSTFLHMADKELGGGLVVRCVLCGSEVVIVVVKVLLLAAGVWK